MIYSETVDPNIALATDRDTAKSQAEAQYSSIEEMVDRLNHCRESIHTYEDYLENPESCCDGVSFDSEEDFDTYHDQDAARQAIDDDPLEVSVRSGWVSNAESMVAEDFMILLCTGGPAVRIRGELDNGEPYRAWIEYQDWGTPWTQYFDAEQSVLLDYAQNFYFGE